MIEKTKKLVPVEVVQTEEYPWWCHPVFDAYLIKVIGDAEHPTREQFQHIQDYFNADFVCVHMENDASDDLNERYCDGENSVLLEWKPSKPTDDEGWFLICINDTEDGAVAWWAKEMEPTNDQS